MTDNRYSACEGKAAAIEVEIRVAVGIRIDTAFLGRALLLRFSTLVGWHLAVHAVSCIWKKL